MEPVSPNPLRNRGHSLPKLTCSVAAACAALCLSGAASAGVILQDLGGGAIQVYSAGTLAQSFVAEDAHILFSFYYQQLNTGYPNDPMELKLVAGAGVGGAVLADQVFQLADHFKGYFDVDLSAGTLAVGNTYTAVLSVPGTSPYWGVHFGPNNYAGGQAYIQGDAQSSFDFRFRVTPTNGNVVPEPVTLAIVGLGLAALAASRRAGRAATSR